MTGAAARDIEDDLVQPFQVESMAAQGRLVRLGETVNTILTAHDYPEPVAHLLGELLIIAAMLSGTLKRTGVLTLQVQGDGPVSILVADISDTGNMRGYARFDQDRLAGLAADMLDSRNPVPLFLGNGRLAFTVDHKGESRPYQGIVPLEGATLAECAQVYFRQSVQADAIFKLAVQRGGMDWRGGGLMLQRLSRLGHQFQSGEIEGQDMEEAWRRAVVLAGSCTSDELVDVSLHPHALLVRLFNEDGVRVFTPEELRMKCRCSADRVRTVLGNFPREEIEDMKIGDDVVVNCEFCNAVYRFAPPDIDALFAPQPGSS